MWDHLGLADCGDRWPYQLSGGQRQGKDYFGIKRDCTGKKSVL